MSGSSDSRNTSFTSASSGESSVYECALSLKRQKIRNELHEFCRQEDKLKTDESSGLEIPGDASFVDPAYLAVIRKAIEYLCRVSLASELIDYPPFQIISTAAGYRSVSMPAAVRWAIAGVFAGLFDTYSNVRSANVANDSFAAAMDFFAKSELPTLMRWLLVFAQVCSLVSFVYGASGNMLGLMWMFLRACKSRFLDQYCESPSLVLYYSVFTVASLFAIPPGIAYYAIFNIMNFISSFKMFVDFLYAGKRDLNGLNARTFAAFFESINIIVFRAISFGAIGDEALEVAFRDNPPKGMSTPVVEIGVSTTATSVLTTRVVKVIPHYSKDEFLILKPDEIKAARENLTRGEYVASIVMSRNMLVSTVSASGLGILLRGFLGMESTLAISLVCAIPSAFLALNIFSQADLVVLNKAVELAKAKNENHFKQEQSHVNNARDPEQQNSSLQVPLVEDRERLSNTPEAKAKRGQEMAKKVFDSLKESFKDDPWIKYAVPTIAIGQVLFARAISFLFFADTLEAYTPLEYSALGLLLFAGAPNVANMIDMFEGGMKETLLSRRAELYVLYCKDIQNKDNPPAFHQWKPSSFSIYWQLFSKGAVDHLISDVDRALVMIDQDETLVYTDYPNRLFQRVKDGIAHLACFNTAPTLSPAD